MKKWILWLGSALWASCVWATRPEPVYYSPELEESYSRWSVDCDNRGTCYAEGRSDKLQHPSREMEGEHQMVFLLKREAGKPAITMQIRLMLEPFKALPHPYERLPFFSPAKSHNAPKKRFFDPLKALPPHPLRLPFYVNGEAQGELRWQQEAQHLSAAQMAAVLAAARGEALPRLEVRWRNSSWSIHGNGMREVLQKMDEVQGFQDTPSALITQGTKPEPTQTYDDDPHFDNRLFLEDEPREILSDTPEGKQLEKLILDSLEKEIEATCYDFYDNYILSQNNPDWIYKFQIWALDEQRDLIVTRCDLGARNEYFAAWITDKAWTITKRIPPHFDFNIVENGFLHDNRIVYNSCYTHSTHAWDGEQFVKVFDVETGSCQGFEEGSWRIPKIRMQLTHPFDLKRIEEAHHFHEGIFD